MDFMEEKEINIKRMFYKTCMRWRSIVMAAFIIALVVSVCRFAVNMISINNEENILAMTRSYETKVTEYEEEGRLIKNNIADTNGLLEEAIDYNRKSLLMQVDPDNAWIGSFNLYVDSGYQVMPGSSIQNENPNIRICYSYKDFVDSGEFYQIVLNKSNMNISEIKYLKEILTVNVDVSRYAIIVNVIGTTEDVCRELLNVSKEAFEEKYAAVSDSIAQHALTAMDPIVYAQIDYRLQDLQKNQQGKIEELTNKIVLLKNELLQWENGKRIEEPIFTVGAAVKDAVKWFLKAGVVAGIVLVIMFCLRYILSGKVEGAESLPTNICVIGEIPAVHKKKNWIDSIINKMFGIVAESKDRENILNVVSCNLSQLYINFSDELKKNGKVALISDMRSEELEELSEQIRGKTILPYKLISAGNPLIDQLAAQRAYEADAVVLVVKQKKTVVTTMKKMVEQLRICNKIILGAVITETDAR